MLGVGLVLIVSVSVGVGVADGLAVCVAVVGGAIKMWLDGEGDAVAVRDDSATAEVEARGLIHWIFDAGVDVHVTSCPRLETVVSTG